MTQISIPLVTDFWRKWRTLRSMDGTARRLLFEALLLPPAILLGFKLLGVSRTQGFLRRWASSQSSGKEFAAEPQRGIALALQAQRLARRKARVGDTCLVRSLTLWALLLRRGVDTQLRVGIRKTGTSFEAHAWLELRGEPLNESPSVVGTYQAFPRPVSFDAWRDMLRHSC